MQKILFTFSLLAVLAGCSRSSPPVAEAPRSPVLATVEGRAITQADFDEEVARQRVGPSSLAADAVLQQLIEREAMLVKAEKAGLADSTAFRHETENRLISQWLAGTLHSDRDAVAVTDEELEAAFEARKNGVFRQGAQHRFAILFRKGKNVEELKAALSEAVAAFVKDRDAATQKGRLTGFGTIAANHSEDTVSRYRGGDLGWFDADKPESSWVPQEVLLAGVEQAAGAVSQPLIAGDGVYVVMKSGVRDAHQIAFKEAAPALRRKLLSEKRSAIEAAFKTGLLADVTVEMKAKPSFKPPPPAKPLQPPSFADGPH
jgi:parvulin-like peptidyl-prolyl isomerase